MTGFRRCLTALAVMALFVGLASAQVGTSGGTNFTPFTCGVQNVTVTPNLRAEGYTEQTGDIVMICSGGSPLAPGAPIPTVDITVYYNVTAVTSRLIPNTFSANASEALLMIDEPNNGRAGSQSGFGPTLPQILCNNTSNGAGPNGCPEYVGTIGANSNVAVAGTTGSGAAASTPGANVFQGIVGGSAVTFYGVPILPPVSAGLSRVFRITNVRVNAYGNGGGFGGAPTPVFASISISGATSLPITQPNPIVGYITPGLKTGVSGAATFNQCNSTTAQAAVLTFSELFGTAFKTRDDGILGGNVSNTTSNPTQNVPGTAYNSESNFVANGNGQSAGVYTLLGTESILNITNGNVTAGLADYGTRLKAVFFNVPSGATLYVSTANVALIGSGTNGITTVPTNNTTGSSYALLLSSETQSDNGVGGVPAASFTNSFTATSSSGNGTSPVFYQAFNSQGNPIVATWEIVNSQPTFLESLSFAVYISYTTTSSTNPPAGTMQVAMSFAPNATLNAALPSDTAAGTASVTNLIPRFHDTGTASTFATIALCETTLLFPYVTTVTGFSTGIAIANTTADPFGTTNQSGVCALNWYQNAANTPPNPISPNTPIIPAGTVFAFNAASPGYAGPNFSGYLIAQCFFQLAHGTAIIQDVAAQNFLATYLALVVPTGVNKRTTVPEALNN